MRVWLVFLAVLALIRPAAAEEHNPQDVHMTIVASTGSREADAGLPTCDNEEIVTLVRQKIAQYQQEHRPNNIVGLRKQAMIFKTLDKFENVDVEQFDNASNYKVADALIMAKINRGLQNGDIRLCRGGFDGSVYLMMYRDADAYRVEIVNFAAEKDFAVYWQPPKADAELPTSEISTDAELPASELPDPELPTAED